MTIKKPRPIILVTDNFNLEESKEFGKEIIKDFENTVSQVAGFATGPTIFTIVVNSDVLLQAEKQILQSLESFEGIHALLYFAPQLPEIRKPNFLIEICEKIRQRHNYITMFVHQGEQSKFKLSPDKVRPIDYEFPSNAVKAVKNYIQCMVLMEGLGQTSTAS